MPTAIELRRTAATDWTDAPKAQWWKHAAAVAVARGAFQIITGRRNAEVYLLRCWLSPVRRIEQEDGARFESGDSLLLHHFLQPDDDGALHDHPWPFTTSILTGGYCERRPLAAVDPDGPGPASYDERWHTRGASVSRAATDLHAVMRLLPDTWTLVKTGPRQRSWFFHPPGEVRVPWREYLARQGKTVPPPRVPSSN